MNDEEAHWAYQFHLLNEVFEGYVLQRMMMKNENRRRIYQSWESN
jgi:hypothetical protein